MTTIRLSLVRHAEVDRTWTGRCYGQSDVLLAPEGIERMRALVNELAREPWAAIIASDLTRCRLLGEALAQRVGVAYSLDARLRERHYGTWESRSWDDLWQEHGESIHATVSKPDTFRPGGGETTYELRDRVMRVVDELRRRQSTGAAAVPHYCLVTHGGPIAAILGTLGGLSVEEWHGLQPRQGQHVSITVQ